MNENNFSNHILERLNFDSSDFANCYKDNNFIQQCNLNEQISCTVVFCESPKDFYIRRDDDCSVFKELSLNLAKVYCKLDCKLHLSDVQWLCGGVPCAVYYEGKWMRGKVKGVGLEDALVQLIDVGSSAGFVKQSLLKPLFKEFGLLPPLAHKCIIWDLDVRGMDVNCVNQFKKVVKDCNGKVLVKFKGSRQRPNEDVPLVGVSLLCKQTGKDLTRTFTNESRKERAKANRPPKKRRQLKKEVDQSSDGEYPSEKSGSISPDCEVMTLDNFSSDQAKDADNVSLPLSDSQITPPNTEIIDDNVATPFTNGFHNNCANRVIVIEGRGKVNMVFDRYCTIKSDSDELVTVYSDKLHQHNLIGYNPQSQNSNVSLRDYLYVNQLVIYKALFDCDSGALLVTALMRSDDSTSDLSSYNGDHNAVDWPKQLHERSNSSQMPDMSSTSSSALLSSSSLEATFNPFASDSCAQNHAVEKKDVSVQVTPSDIPILRDEFIQINHDPHLTDVLLELCHRCPYICSYIMGGLHTQ